MTVDADHVRQLLDCAEPEPTMVLVEGRIDIVAAADLRSGRLPGAVEVTTREQVLDNAGHTDLSAAELQEQAAILDSTLTNLGA